MRLCWTLLPLAVQSSDRVPMRANRPELANSWEESSRNRELFRHSLTMVPAAALALRGQPAYDVCHGSPTSNASRLVVNR